MSFFQEVTRTVTSFTLVSQQPTELNAQLLLHHGTVAREARSFSPATNGEGKDRSRTSQLKLTIKSTNSSCSLTVDNFSINNVNYIIFHYSALTEEMIYIRLDFKDIIVTAIFFMIRLNKRQMKLHENIIK
jgi:hypothetical protein